MAACTTKQNWNECTTTYFPGTNVMLWREHNQEICIAINFPMCFCHTATLHICTHTIWLLLFLVCNIKSLYRGKKVWNKCSFDVTTSPYFVNWNISGGVEISSERLPHSILGVYFIDSLARFSWPSSTIQQPPVHHSNILHAGILKAEINKKNPTIFWRYAIPFAVFNCKSPVGSVLHCASTGFSRAYLYMCVYLHFYEGKSFIFLL